MGNIITKALLIEQLVACQNKKITAQDLQDWMINHFDPPETQVGVDENELIQEAMSIIMNEYELVKIDKLKIEGITLALDFLKSNEGDFDRKRYQFLHNAFAD